MMVLAASRDDPVAGTQLESSPVVLAQGFHVSGLVPTTAFRLFKSSERAESFTTPQPRKSQGLVSAAVVEPSYVERHFLAKAPVRI
jgi:hypothetical protein